MNQNRILILSGHSFSRFRILIRFSSTFKSFKQTKEWPITCTFDPKCLFNFMKQVESHWLPILSSKSSHGKRSQNHESGSKYILSMFPYPSGSLHLGHVKIYTTADILARYYRLKGFNVINPIGWDSFGLPAENAAIQKNLDPKDWTYSNIETMKKQLENLGLNVNWKEATSDPSFYKWTQWLSLKLLASKLIYKSMGQVNWDPVDQTVLANDQVDEDGRSWRSGALVEKRYLSQWYVKVNALVEKLYQGEGINRGQSGIHLEHILKSQQQWFGLLTGYVFYLSLDDKNTLPLFTEQPEQFLNPNVQIIVSKDHWLADNVRSGTVHVTNPFNDNKTRVEIILAPDSDLNFQIPTNFNATLSAGEENLTSRSKVLEHCSKNVQLGGYKSSSTYTDWCISRQRYWGCPIPVVECIKCGHQPVPESDLPILLPEVKGQSFNQASRQGSNSSSEIRGRLSDLAPKSWLETKCPNCGSDAVRETDTFDTFVDSSWYYLRFGSTKFKSDLEPFDLDPQQVFVYLGGPEHARGHLIFARFIFMFLKSSDLIQSPFSEPFEKLLLQGIVAGKTLRLSKDGSYLSQDQYDRLLSDGKIRKEDVLIKYEKMSKSKGNGIDPSDLVAEFGTDSTRFCVLGTSSSDSSRLWRGSDNEMLEVTKFWRKLILTVDQFIFIRQLIDEDKKSPMVKRFPARNAKSQEIITDANFELKQMRNRAILGVTLAMEHTFNVGRGSKVLQELLDTMRKFCLIKEVAWDPEYERSLGDLLILLHPIIPHLTAEAWNAFSYHCSTSLSTNYNLDKEIYDQVLPQLDSDFVIPIRVTIDETIFKSVIVPRDVINRGNQDEILNLVLQSDFAKEMNLNQDQVIKINTIPSLSARVIFKTGAKIIKKKSKKDKKDSKQDNDDEITMPVN